MNGKNRKSVHGFTLIEMLTVVVIIGILTGIVVPQYRRAIQRAKVTQAISMLRVINDAASRLADEFGYKTFDSFSTDLYDGSNATFRHLDMFNDDTIDGCTFDDVKMTCDDFEYYLNKGGGFTYARKKSAPYAGVEIRLYREDPPRLTCVSNGTAGCDVYSFDVEVGGS